VRSEKEVVKKHTWTGGEKATVILNSPEIGGNLRWGEEESSLSTHYLHSGSCYGNEDDLYECSVAREGGSKGLGEEEDGRVKNGGWAGGKGKGKRKEMDGIKVKGQLGKKLQAE